MQNQQHIIDCYNKTAFSYTEKFAGELDHKHFDRMILKAFVAENSSKGRSIDLGCGPGQTTRFLADQGIKEIMGTDLSPEMIKAARGIHPDLTFETADMLALPYDENSFGSAVCFYAIVHFDYDQVSIALREVNRILKPGGGLLFSFHVGTQTVHLDNFLDQQVNIDFYFFELEKIISLLGKMDWEIVDCIQRQPYPEFEYPSTRAYIWVTKKK